MPSRTTVDGSAAGCEVVAVGSGDCVAVGSGDGSGEVVVEGSAVSVVLGDGSGNVADNPPGSGTENEACERIHNQDTTQRAAKMVTTSKAKAKATTATTGACRGSVRVASIMVPSRSRK